MFGEEGGPDRPELVRLAIPRRSYSNVQLAQVARCFAGMMGRRGEIRGVAILEEPPVLRHFTARFGLV